MRLRKSFVPSRLVLWSFLSVMMAGWAVGGARAQSGDACGPSPAIQSALDQLPEYRQDPAVADWQVHARRLAGLQDLLRRYPNDVFVQRAYIRGMGTARGNDQISMDEHAKVIAEYKAHHEQNPDDAHIAYLYALTLVGRDSPQAIKLLEGALAKDPNFALPHLELASIYYSPVFQDKPKATANVRAYLDACPESFAGYDYVSWVDAKDLLNSYAAKLRTVVQSRSDAAVIGAYQTLWSLEFKAHPPSEYAPLREQVARDLERLRKLDFQDKRQWYEALQDGYKLANDQKQADAVEDRRKQRFPSPYDGMGKWYKDHPWPADDASADTRRTYFHDLLAETDQWLKLYTTGIDVPLSIRSTRVEVMEHLDDVPAAEVETAVDTMLKLDGANVNDGPWDGDYSMAAGLLSKKHLEPQRVVEFAQKGLAIMEITAKAPSYDLYDTKENQERSRFYRLHQQLSFQGYEVDGYLELKQADKAQPLLAQMDRELQDLKSLAGDDQDRKDSYASKLAGYWGESARLAEVEGRKLDAMGFYENALLTRLAAKQKPVPGEKDELADNAHQLWTGLGGTEDGWQLWYGHPANELASQVTLTWKDSHEPLAGFELADLNGKSWNLAALKGKTVFVNFWATWCGYCREELPRLQKLTEQYKNRSDVQFVTLNVDDNPGLIAPFLKEQKLDLLVIPAHDYVLSTLNVNAFPQNWIVDAKGVVRLKGIGYDPTEKWETGMKDAIEKVKDGANSTASP